MKGKHVLCFITIVIGIVTIAAGVAVFVDHLLKKKDNCYEGYIESDCTPEDIEEQ